MDLPRTGLWSSGFDMLDANASARTIAELEDLGYGALWIPETMGRDRLTHAALLLSRSESIIVATGVTSIWARDPMAMRAGHLALAEAYPDRFLLGLGVSHAPMVSGLRGHDYDRPLRAMRTYLAAMDSALYLSPQPATAPSRVIAALGPKMLHLAAEEANGAHTYLVPPEHTAIARDELGPDAILAVEQKAVISADRDGARALARDILAIYLALPNYTNNLQRLGWTDDDIADGASDALFDALVAWGDVDAIVNRVQQHLDAGATHVCVQTLGAELFGPTPDEWRALAPALNAL
jgi:probable F420-dependent oxidoreductase